MKNKLKFKHATLCILITFTLFGPLVYKAFKNQYTTLEYISLTAVIWIFEVLLMQYIEQYINKNE